MARLIVLCEQSGGLPPTWTTRLHFDRPRISGHTEEFVIQK
jgi:hypothetical protein